MNNSTGMNESINQARVIKSVSKSVSKSLLSTDGSDGMEYE